MTERVTDGESEGERDSELHTVPEKVPVMEIVVAKAEAEGFRVVEEELEGQGEEEVHREGDRETVGLRVTLRPTLVETD